MIKQLKKLNIYHILSVVITLIFLLLSVFVFRPSFWRLVESGRDCGISVAYYFCVLFDLPHNIIPTVNRLPELPIIPSPVPGLPTVNPIPVPMPAVPLPKEYPEFVLKLKAWGRLLITRSNFIVYFNLITNILFYVCQIIMMVLPLVFIIYAFTKRYLKQENNNYNQDTTPLKIYKRSVGWFNGFIRRLALGYSVFLRKHRFYVVL